MRQSLWIALTVVLVGGPVVCMQSARSMPARVFARNDRVHVTATTGPWYHEYSLVFGVAHATVTASDSTASAATTNIAADTVSLNVGRDEFDLARVGTRVRLKQVAFAGAQQDSRAPVQISDDRCA